MRSRPATWTALVLRTILWSISTHEAWWSSSFTRSPQSARDDVTRPTLFAKHSSRRDPEHYGGRRPVLPCVEDSLRRPQRPGNQRAPKRVLEDLPGNSPSRITRNRRLCPQCPGRANRTSRLDGSHCARSLTTHQGKSRASLCRSCARQNFLVETHGKPGAIFRFALSTQSTKMWYFAFCSLTIRGEVRTRKRKIRQQVSGQEFRTPAKI